MQPPAALPPHIHTYGPLWYPIECFWYWFPLGAVVHGAFFLAGVILIGAIFLFRRGHFRRWFSRWAVFNVCLFVTAGLTNGLWSCFIFGRLYWSADYIFDFTPFWPVTQRTLDFPHGREVGGLLGISLLQLQALWVPFAVTAWVSAFALYRFYSARHASRIAAPSI